MNASVFLCHADKIEEGRFSEHQLTLDDEPVYLVATRLRGEPRAWHNVCPHQGRALNFAPDRFLTDKHGHLVCAAHGAVFEPDEGRCVSGPCRNACLKAIALTETDRGVFAQLSP